jgi:C-terminal processing protease CtpA/Prc
MKELSRAEKAAILKKVKKFVLRYHINVGGINYDEWARTLDSHATELTEADDRQFETGVRALLADLGTSHTGFFREVPDLLLPQHSLNSTLRKVQIAGADRWMFLDVFEDGAADRAGIRPSDVLLAVNGESVPTDDVPKFGIGRKYTFTIRRANRNDPEDVTVEVPFVKGSKAHPPLVPPKTLSYKMLQPGMGYLKVGWFTASMGLGFSKELDAAVAELKKNGCGRLIIDLRGNIGGGLGFARLCSYMCPGKTPIGQSLTPKRLRTGYDRTQLPRVPMPSTALGLIAALTRFLVKDKSLVLLTQGLGPQPFHGNIVVLVNEFTNSAAEMVANFAFENKVATVIGTRTSGTVLGARNVAVGAGYWLRVPVFGWFSSDGSTIERTGVIPDSIVEPDPRQLAQGDDRQLSAAVSALTGVAESAAVRTRA